MSPPPSGQPSASPVPLPTPSGAGSSATINLPDGSRLVLTLPNRFLTDSGQSVTVSAQLLDANGQPLPLNSLQLLYSSSRPQDFSISDQGVITALVNDGYSTITVRINGTELSASQLISVSALSSGGGGGGGGGGSSSPSPRPVEETVNAEIGFEGLRLGEFRVGYSEDSEESPAVAVAPDGRFVIAWTGDDDNGSGIYAQRYNAYGEPQGAEFRVNTETENDQEDPDVAMDANGNFVVVWDSDNQDGDDTGVYAQRYDSQGNPLGSEVQVNTQTDDDQEDPAVAMDTNGDFVVAWTGYDDNTEDNSVYIQRYDNLGETAGSEMRVNNNTDSDKYDVDVAMDADGDFVVVWEGEEYNDGYIYGVYARRYDSLGAEVDNSEFRVNVSTDSDHYDPSVASDAVGNFTIVWENDEQQAIYGRQYTSAGSGGSEFRVNTFSNSEVENASIAMNAVGQFVVAWDIEGQDGAETGVYAQRFNSTAVPQGSEFSVNTVPYFSEEYPSVAMDASGRFGVVWYGSGDYAGDDDDIFGQLYLADGTVRGIPAFDGP